MVEVSEALAKAEEQIAEGFDKAWELKMLLGKLLSNKIESLSQNSSRVRRVGVNTLLKKVTKETGRCRAELYRCIDRWRYRDELESLRVKNPTLCNSRKIDDMVIPNLKRGLDPMTPKPKAVEPIRISQKLVRAHRTQYQELKSFNETLTAFRDVLGDEVMAQHERCLERAAALVQEDNLRAAQQELDLLALESRGRGRRPKVKTGDQDG